MVVAKQETVKLTYHDCVNEFKLVQLDPIF